MKLLDSSMLGGTQSTFVGVAVLGGKTCQGRMQDFSVDDYYTT
jgi:hypothetical protein